MKVNLGYEVLETYNDLKELGEKEKENLKNGEKIKVNRIKRKDKEFINYAQIKDGLIDISKEEIKKGDK